MLVPKVPVEEFKKFGFKKCKGIYKDCLYLCVARGNSMLFVSPMMYAINKWSRYDPRIHERANCKWRDKRDVMDITYQLIKAGMLKMETEEEENRPWFPVGTILYEYSYEYDWKIQECLPCDGREVSRSDYLRLFKAISDKFGEGDGRTTFNLPNFLPQKCSIVCKEMKE